MMHSPMMSGNTACATVAADGFLIQRILEKHLSAANAGALWRQLSALVVSGETRLIVDLSRVVLIDSCAIRALLWLQRLVGCGGKLVLFGLRPRVAEAFGMLTMNPALTIVTNEQQAIQAMLADARPASWAIGYLAL